MRYTEQDYHRKRRRRREEEEEEESGNTGLFSNSHTVLILTVVVGCFGVLWPKIFSPMFFGDGRSSHQDISEDPIGSFQGGMFPDHPNPSMRARMGAPHPGLAAGHGRPVDRPLAAPVRTIDKEWPDKHPRPGMRPTLGGPGIQPSQKQQQAGSMGVVMPIYTVAILVFFIYTIVKILFKNNKNEEEEEDEEFLNSEYYKDYMKQKKRQEERQKMKTEQIVPRPDSGSHQKEEINERAGKSEDLPCHETINSSTSKDEVGKSDKQTDHNGPLDKPEVRKVVTFDTPLEGQAKKPNNNTKEMKSGKSQDSSRVADTIDPRDLEIELLKARLEQTEKALETILTQMADINTSCKTSSRLRKNLKKSRDRATKPTNAKVENNL